MVEKLTERRISSIELMRAVSSSFDDNVIIAGSTDSELIPSGILMPAWMGKARLLSSVQSIFTSDMPSSSDILEQENMQLRNENLILRDAIRRIEERLATIEAYLPHEKVIILREISKEVAKKEIKELFSKGKTLFYSDIAQELGLDLELVVNICNELKEQGDITVDAGVS